MAISDDDKEKFDEISAELRNDPELADTLNMEPTLAQTSRFRSNLIGVGLAVIAILLGFNAAVAPDEPAHPVHRAPETEETRSEAEPKAAEDPVPYAERW